MLTETQTTTDLAETSGTSPTKDDGPLLDLNKADRSKNFFWLLKFVSSGSLKVTASERRILVALIANNTIYTPTITQIADELKIFKGNISRSLQSLIKKDLLFIDKHIRLSAGRKTPRFLLTDEFSKQFSSWKNSLRSYQTERESYHPGTSEVMTKDNKEYKYKPKKNDDFENDYLQQLGDFLNKAGSNE